MRAIGGFRSFCVALRRPFTGPPLPPRRCMSDPYGGFTTMLNPRQISTFPPRRDVRFGSKADICSAIADVRFTPNSDIDCVFRRVRFGPKADIADLIDHLIG